MLQYDRTTKQIQVNRGDSIDMNITARDTSGEPYSFQENDVVKFKISEAKNEENVVIEKSIPILAETQSVHIYVSSDETKLGDYNNKPVKYWYEISIEKPNSDVMTIIGYDNDGPKEFILNPEAGNKETGE